jgi:hypothetical protein
MLGRCISAEAGYSNEAGLRGAVNDNSAPLRPHLPQLVLHTIENAPEVDGDYAIEVASLHIGGIGPRDMDASIVEGRVQPAKCRNCLLYNGCDFRLFGHVAADANGLISRRDECLGRGASRALVYVGQYHGRARFRESFRRGESDASACTRDEYNLAFE